MDFVRAGLIMRGGREFEEDGEVEGRFGGRLGGMVMVVEVWVLGG